MAVSDLVEVKPRQCVDDEPCPDMVFAKVVKNHKIAHHVVVTGKRRRERAAALKTLALLEGCRTRADALVGTDLSDVPCGDHEDFVQALKNMGGDPYQSEGPGLPPRPDPQGWMSPWDLWKGVVNPKENTQDLENEAAVGTDANLNEDNLGANVADADDDDDNDPDEGLVSAADNKGEEEEEEEGGGMASSQWRTRPRRRWTPNSRRRMRWRRRRPSSARPMRRTTRRKRFRRADLGAPKFQTPSSTRRAS